MFAAATTLSIGTGAGHGMHNPLYFFDDYPVNMRTGTSYGSSINIACFLDFCYMPVSVIK